MANPSTCACDGEVHSAQTVAGQRYLVCSKCGERVPFVFLSDEPIPRDWYLTDVLVAALALLTVVAVCGIGILVLVGWLR